MLIKQKSPLLPRNLALVTFHKLLIVFSHSSHMLSSASDKAKLFAENFSKNSNLDDSGIAFPVFPSRTNLKLHISITPKMVKKVIMNLDLSRASGPDCIPVVVLRNCEPVNLVFQIAGRFTGLFHKLSDQIFGLISSFLSNRQFQGVLDGKSSQEYQLYWSSSRVHSWFYTFPVVH